MSYYGLYLLNYLQDNKFEQAADRAFIKERADRAAEIYEQARLDGSSASGAQELANGRARAWAALFQVRHPA